MQRRFDVLRAATEESGGRFVDLHMLLPQAEFADFGGHFGPVGAQHIASVVSPIVVDALRQARADARVRRQGAAAMP
jgi:hypothetical protein